MVPVQCFNDYMPLFIVVSVSVQLWVTGHASLNRKWVRFLIPTSILQNFIHFRKPNRMVSVKIYMILSFQLLIQVSLINSKY